MLSDLRQLNPVAHAVFSCIQVVYKVGSLCVFNVNDITYFFLAAFEDSRGNS